MEQFQPYIPLALAGIAAVAGYGALNARVKKLEEEMTQKLDKEALNEFRRYIEHQFTAINTRLDDFMRLLGPR